MGAVSKSSNSVRSLVKPALHVGKHSGGGVGWCASAGSFGTAGACTTGGGEGGNVLAQPVTSISSGNSISAGAFHGLAGIIGGFLHLCGAALFFGAGVGFGLSCSFGQLSDLQGVLGACVGVVGLLAGQAPGLHASDCDGSQQAGGEYAGHASTAMAC